jgi:hypothetical protein
MADTPLAQLDPDAQQALAELGDSLAALDTDERAAVAELAQARADGECSRRDLLKAAGAIGTAGLAAGGSAFALTGSAAADASTSDSDPDVGTPSNRADIWAAGVDANVIDAGDLKGKYPSKVRVVNADGNDVATVDPSNTSTPVNDALNIAAPVSGATVIVPPAGVTEDATITSKEDTILRSHGINSKIEVAESVSDLVDVGDNHFQIRDVQITGSDADLNGPTGRRGITFSASSRAFSMHNVRISSFIGRGYHEPSTVAPFEHVHGYVNITNVDAGGEEALFDVDSTGRANRIACLAVGPADDNSAADSDIIDISNSQSWTFGAVNVGGSAGRILNETGAKHAMIMESNYEPSTQNSTPGSVFRIAGRGNTFILNPEATGLPSVDYVWEIDNGGNAWLFDCFNMDNKYNESSNAGVVRNGIQDTVYWHGSGPNTARWDNPDSVSSTSLRLLNDAGSSVL